MYGEIIDEIMNHFDEGILSSSYPKFSGEGYGAYKIDSKNFHPLNGPLSSKRMAFVDGGNAEIIGAANFSLSLVRVGYVIYQNKTRVEAKKFEVFVLIKS